MKKKFIDPALYPTRGKMHIKRGLSGRTVTGRGFSKRAHSWYSYKNFNQEGKTNIINYGDMDGGRENKYVN